MSIINKVTHVQCLWWRRSVVDTSVHWDMVTMPKHGPETV